MVIAPLRNRIPTSPREWFVLGIRLFGLWLLTRGVGCVANFVDFRLGLNELPPGTSSNGYLFYAASDFALAAYFSPGARHMACICEGGKSSDEGHYDEEISQRDGIDSGLPDDQE